jgi:hypothetical protein
MIWFLADRIVTECSQIVQCGIVYFFCLFFSRLLLSYVATPAQVFALGISPVPL